MGWFSRLFAPSRLWSDEQIREKRCLLGIQDAADYKLSELTRAKDAAYAERNKVVAGLAALALVVGWKAGRARTAIEGWDEDWHGCVYIDLPDGQVSWHFHDSEAGLFDFLPLYDGAWDGHDTPEKYRRVLALRSR